MDRYEVVFRSGDAPPPSSPGVVGMVVALVVLALVCVGAAVVFLRASRFLRSLREAQAARVAARAGAAAGARAGAAATVDLGGIHFTGGGAVPGGVGVRRPVPARFDYDDRGGADEHDDSGSDDLYELAGGDDDDDDRFDRFWNGDGGDADADGGAPSDRVRRWSLGGHGGVA